MTISFSETGIVVDTQEQVRDQMAANAKVNLAPFLGQTELKTDDSIIEFDYSNYKNKITILDNLKNNRNIFRKNRSK